MLVLGFVITIFAGTLMLMLPYAVHGDITFIDAFFTSTSAVCVTGLIVKNTPVDFTLFGQIVILVLIQIGGLGYMSMATFVALLAGKRISISERILIRESLNMATLEGIVRFMKGMLLFVLLAEGTGSLVLFMKFLQEYPPSEALMMGVFHSISAFNNAGFSLFADSLVRYRGDIIINAMIAALIILGGTGFIVFDNLYAWINDKRKALTLHTYIVLTSTCALILIGAVAVYFTERKYMFAGAGMSNTEIVLSTFFASATARTAGFNTIDYSLLQPATIFLTIFFMIVGASPGSTGGGIKTTTFSVIFIHLWSTIRGRRETSLFRRRIPEDMISKSFVILAIAVIFINIVTFAVIEIEHSGFQRTMFEVASAFGTVGLSTGDGGTKSFCATFSGASKIIIIITMLAGRLGPLTLFTALVKQREERVRFPEGRVMIG